MRVLFCVDDFKGGAGNVIQLLSIELAKRNHHVAICCLGGFTPGRHPIDGIPVYRIKGSKNTIVKYLHYIRGVRCIVKHEKPDCVVSFLFGTSSWVNLAMVGMKTPLIVSERSDPNYLVPHGLMVLLTELAYRRAKRIVVLFEDFKNISGNKYYNKTVAIPNPVPTIPLLQTDSHSYDEEIRFVTIANDSPPKGLDLLVKAFAGVARSNSHIVLRIYGKESERLRQMIQAERMQDRVRLMGYTLNVNEALSWSDVYVMPSRHEGFPNSLCEAMSAGKCCIATLCHNGIKDLIIHKENGYIASEATVKAIGEQLSYVIEHPEVIKATGKKARALSQKYPLNKVVSMWEGLIDEVVKNR